MTVTNFTTSPSRKHYDVVIIGGATSGSSIAWHLSQDPDFKGSVLVVERDPSLQYSASKASNNCMRQQFATEINVKIAQYAADFVNKFGNKFGPDPCVPNPPIRNFGYLYLSDSPHSRKSCKRTSSYKRAVVQAQLSYLLRIFRASIHGLISMTLTLGA